METRTPAHEKLTCGVLVMAALAALGFAPAAAAGLLVEPQAGDFANVPEHVLEKALRARPVDIDLSALADSLEPGSELQLDFFADLSLTATCETVTITGPNSFSWKGSFPGEPTSSAILVVTDGVLAGGFTVAGRRFQIDPGVADRHYVYEIDLARLPSDDSDSVVPDSKALVHQARLAPASPAKNSDAQSVFDLAVFYTKKAKKAAGGKRALKALVKLGVAETNAALEDSRVDARFELVKIRKIPYGGTSDIPTDLERLQDPSDGYLDKAHTLRDRYRADAVLLVVAPSDRNRCGRAFLSPLAGNPADWAFGVLRYDCISPNYTFGHELGHIMGLEHARVSGANQPYRPYGFGYHEPNGLFRTMMATSQPGMGARVLHFSNPSVVEQQVPTGIDSSRADAADSARAINDARHLLASYR